MVQAKPAERPTVVVFDLGNVLLDWSPETLYRDLIPEPERRAHFLNNVGTLDWHARWDRGETFEDLARERIAQFPAFEAEILAWNEQFAGMFSGYVTGMAPLAEALLDAGPVYAITNLPDPQLNTILSLFPLLERFEGILVSGTEKVAKPDPRIFELFLERYGLAASQCVFLDDRAENVRAAQSVGFYGHLFEDAAGARAFLEGFGLLS